MTYSIVARDPATGELGVAVQSHWFSVGSLVTWARPGAGAVATQAIGRAAYGPRGLELMAGGMGAADALAAAISEDPDRAIRQVAMIDAHGAAAAFTGERCIGDAGDVQDDEVSCQANLMARPGVPEAMLEAFVWQSGPLAARMLSALRAAQAAGGDLRGRQSAALLVVPGSGEPWQTTVSLRVEDAPEPLDELARLLALHDAYHAAGAGDEAAAEGDADAAARHYRRARELAPDQPELRFWAALGLARVGEDEAALRELRAIVDEDPAWRELLTRLPAELAPSAAGLLRRLQ